jgi:hypothetical protein
MTTQLAEIGEHHAMSWRDDHVVGADVSMMGAQRVDRRQRQRHAERFGQGLLERHGPGHQLTAFDMLRDQPDAPRGRIVDELERRGQMRGRDGAQQLERSGNRSSPIGRDVLENHRAPASIIGNPGPAFGPTTEASDVSKPR